MHSGPKRLLSSLAGPDFNRSDRARCLDNVVRSYPVNYTVETAFILISYRQLQFAIK